MTAEQQPRRGIAELFRRLLRKPVEKPTATSVQQPLVQVDHDKLINRAFSIMIAHNPGVTVNAASGSIIDAGPVGQIDQHQYSIDQESILEQLPNGWRRRYTGYYLVQEVGDEGPSLLYRFNKNEVLGSDGKPASALQIANMQEIFSGLEAQLGIGTKTVQ